MCALAQPSIPSATAGAFEPARLVRSVLPVAPHLEPGDQVDVVLLLDVDTEGRVVGVTVSEPGGEAFDRAAETAARQFVFAPARLAGKPLAGAGHLSQPLRGAQAAGGRRAEPRRAEA